ncbi:MAG: hypothetical protein NZM25_09790 [Leptospiraceae bacterium]|nr:hypothetical protein [Leptospiraceae bacterium]MDW8306450.1 hypothetical protein [Leptospiraceae bacterium]
MRGSIVSFFVVVFALSAQNFPMRSEPREEKREEKIKLRLKSEKRGSVESGGKEKGEIRSTSPSETLEPEGKGEDNTAGEGKERKAEKRAPAYREGNTSARIDTDEMPYIPPEIDQRENVFGDKFEKDEILSKMEYQIGFISEGGLFDNADLRKLNESNQATIDLTDDRLSLAYSRFFLNLFFPLSETFFFRVDVFKNGFWGNDQLGGASTNNNSASTPIGADPFAFGELYLQSVIWRTNWSDLMVRVGRQFFEIGGVTNDYMLRDILDAITVHYADSRVGNFHLLLFDVFQMAGDATLNVNYVRFFSHDNRRVQNFNGDVNTIRHGLVYESRNILRWRRESTSKDPALRARLYGFFARFGAVSQGGSDRTNLGATGNFADNDYTAMVGNRWNFTMPMPLAFKNELRVYVDGAYSFGIDRRLPTAAGESQDIDTRGYAGGGGVDFYIYDIRENFDVEVNLDGFWAKGPHYNRNGIQTSHGFVSFKGNYMGGLLLNRFWGVRPYAYVANNGIADFPHEYNKKSGAWFGHIGGAITFYDLVRLGLDYWLVGDTGKSELFASGDTSWVTSTVLKAQERHGKLMGQEMNLSLNYFHSKYWTVYVIGAVFLPGAYYATPGIKPNSPYGHDTFWGFLIGSRLIF